MSAQQSPHYTIFKATEDSISNTITGESWKKHANNKEEILFSKLKITRA